MARRGVLRMPLHDRIADEMAAALARHQIALADQLLVREHHCVARDAQVIGQVAAGRHRRAGRQVAAEDGRDQHLAHAALQAEIGALSRSNRRSHNTGLSIAAWLDMAAPSEGGGRGRQRRASGAGAPRRAAGSVLQHRGAGGGKEWGLPCRPPYRGFRRYLRRNVGCKADATADPTADATSDPALPGSPAVPGSAPADRRRRRRRRSR